MGPGARHRPHPRRHRPPRSDRRLVRRNPRAAPRRRQLSGRPPALAEARVLLSAPSRPPHPGRRRPPRRRPPGLDRLDRTRARRPGRPAAALSAPTGADPSSRPRFARAPGSPRHLLHPPHDSPKIANARLTPPLTPPPRASIIAGCSSYPRHQPCRPARRPSRHKLCANDLPAAHVRSRGPERTNETPAVHVRTRRRAKALRARRTRRTTPPCAGSNEMPVAHVRTRRRAPVLHARRALRTTPPRARSNPRTGSERHEGIRLPASKQGLGPMPVCRRHAGHRHWRTRP